MERLRFSLSIFNHNLIGCWGNSILEGRQKWVKAKQCRADQTGEAKTGGSILISSPCENKNIKLRMLTWATTSCYDVKSMLMSEPLGIQKYQTKHDHAINNSPRPCCIKDVFILLPVVNSYQVGSNRFAMCLCIIPCFSDNKKRVMCVRFMVRRSANGRDLANVLVHSIAAAGANPVSTLDLYHTIFFIILVWFVGRFVVPRTNPKSVDVFSKI